MPIQKAKVEQSEYGRMPDGATVGKFTVRHGGWIASFIGLGARLISLQAPDRNGAFDEVVLGFASLDAYLADTSYQGAVVGRYGNRIAGGRFKLDGHTYQVPPNNGANALHGGPVGFDRKLWHGSAIDHGVEFVLESAEGDQGFPGKLTVKVQYTFTPGELRIDYAAETDAPTVVNLTNHAYFNLAGQGSVSILGHRLQILATQFTPVCRSLIPTGELATVEGTPFDFRAANVIGTRIDTSADQLAYAGGYDHNWAFGSAGIMKEVAVLQDPVSGRQLRVNTTEPGLQFYSGNFLDGSMLDRRGHSIRKRSGLCLETQHYPDSPNQPQFPSTELRPGRTWTSTTVYTFQVQHPDQDVLVDGTNNG